MPIGGNIQLETVDEYFQNTKQFEAITALLNAIAKSASDKELTKETQQEETA